MSVTVGPNTTFSQVYAEHDPTKGAMAVMGMANTEHLRGDPNGTILYTHGTFSFSGRGDQAEIERKAKWADGSATVRQTIDNEYGNGVGAAVFQKMMAEGGPDLRQEVMRGNLPQIRSAINEVSPGSIPELDGPSTPLKAALDQNQTRQATIFGPDPTYPRGVVTRSGTTDQRLTQMFGRRLTDGDIRGLGGMPDGCNVKLDVVALNPYEHPNTGANDQGIMISKSGADPSGAFKTIQMTVYRDRSGNLNIYRDKTASLAGPTNDNVNAQRPTHLGTCAIVKQVDTARALGVNTIHNFSAGGKGYNGHYTWARCGGNASLALNSIHFYDHEQNGSFPLRGKTNLRDEDRGAYQSFRVALAASNIGTIQGLNQKPDLDVQDFMLSPEGRTFWRDNGFPLPLEFNLQPGSKTMQTMAQYTVPNSCFDLR